MFTANQHGGQTAIENILMNDDVKPFLVPQTHTIRQAMEQLERTEEKIVFVVDEDSRLVGSLTDGDIRRWILSDGDLKAQVVLVCNCNPHLAKEGFAIEEVRAAMLEGNFGCVPVINSFREVVQLIFWKEIFQDATAKKAKRQLNLPVIIMAGGRGTRLAPFTNVLPKPLIPIGDKTVIELIIEQLTPYGLDQFQLSINYKSRILKSFFEELAPPYSVKFLEEREPRGTAGALRELYSPTQENLLVTNCDVVIQADMAELKIIKFPMGCANWKRVAPLLRLRKSPNTVFLLIRECMS
jgi:CBS domain-containing protein